MNPKNQMAIMLSLVQSSRQKSGRVIAPAPSWSVSKIWTWLGNCGVFAINGEQELCAAFNVLRHERGILFWTLKSEKEIAELEEKGGFQHNGYLLAPEDIGENGKEMVNYCITHDEENNELVDIECCDSMTLDKYRKITENRESLRHWCDRNRNYYTYVSDSESDEDRAISSSSDAEDHAQKKAKVSDVE